MTGAGLTVLPGTTLSGLISIMSESCLHFDFLHSLPLSRQPASEEKSMLKCRITGNPTAGTISRMEALDLYVRSQNIRKVSKIVSISVKQVLHIL